MWLALALFVLLSPGLFFRLGHGLQSVAIHAALFGVALWLMRGSVRIEGFQDAHVEGWQLGNSCGEEYCKTPKEYCKQKEDGTKYCSEEE
jgi:hypothetical protein